MVCQIKFSSSLLRSRKTIFGRRGGERGGEGGGGVNFIFGGLGLDPPPSLAKAGKPCSSGAGKPCSSGAGGVGLFPANSDATNVPSLWRWRFEIKLSPCFVGGGGWGGAGASEIAM